MHVAYSLHHQIKLNSQSKNWTVLYTRHKALSQCKVTFIYSDKIHLKWSLCPSKGWKLIAVLCHIYNTTSYRSLLEFSKSEHTSQGQVGWRSNSLWCLPLCKPFKFHLVLVLSKRSATLTKYCYFFPFLKAWNVTHPT